MARKKPAAAATTCHQPIPLKLGDIVRVHASSAEEQEFEHHIAVVVEKDTSKDNGGYPYRMRLMDHPYQDDIWFSSYERIGNVTEVVALLEWSRASSQAEQQIQEISPKRK